MLEQLEEIIGEHLDGQYFLQVLLPGNIEFHVLPMSNLPVTKFPEEGVTKMGAYQISEDIIKKLGLYISGMYNSNDNNLEIQETTINVIKDSDIIYTIHFAKTPLYNLAPVLLHLANAMSYGIIQSAKTIELLIGASKWYNEKAHVENIPVVEYKYTDYVYVIMSAQNANLCKMFVYNDQLYVYDGREIYEVTVKKDFWFSSLELTLKRKKVTIMSEEEFYKAGTKIQQVREQNKLREEE